MPDLHLGKTIRLRTPPLGLLSLVAANLILLLVLHFYDFDTTNHAVFETIAYRAGFLALGQIPLIFLLSGKNNLIGLFTGHSYERLNYLHRWTARCLLITITIHLGYWLGNWIPYGYYRDDITTRSGLSAWAILIWIVMSSWAPLRNWRYEFFVVQHLVSFIAFTVMILIHTPSNDHVWIWIGAAIFLFDRAVRSMMLVYTNLALFHPEKRKEGACAGLFTCRAHLTPLPHNTTRVTIYNPPVSWTPGQHAYLAIQSIAPLQAHPFSIASIPSDEKLEFLVRAHTGGTKRLLDYSQTHHWLSTTREPIKGNSVPVTIDGPYGRLRPLEQFDTVILLAGSTGASFTMPLLRDLVRRWKEPGSRATPLRPAGAATRRVRFVWAVKSGAQLAWLSRQLAEALEDVAALRAAGVDVQLHASVYVTCDEGFTREWNERRRPASPGPRASRFVKSWGDVEDARCDGASAEEGSVSEDLEKAVKEYDGAEVTEKEVDARSNADGISAAEKHTGKGKGAGKGRGCPCGCGCQATLKNEDPSSSSAAVPCCCSSHSHADAAAAELSRQDHHTASEKRGGGAGDGLHRDVAVLTGRPHPRTIVRRSLERAAGEAAVVACGPRSMNDDVRRTVVRLSDERAVGRGTGALGVWFWGEGFGL